jgi:6-pyruvoyltetrahydropterin/6-carboxytetrahydropterin synthase
MIYVSRRETFSASHRLHNPSLSDEENLKYFGKCNSPNGHGHNYTLVVTVAGEINPVTGYLIDLKKLKEIIKENVIDKVDHKNLDRDVEFLNGVITTTENLAVKFWEQLVNKIPDGKLYSIRIKETENNFFEYKGELV